MVKSVQKKQKISNAGGENKNESEARGTVITFYCRKGNSCRV